MRRILLAFTLILSIICLANAQTIYVVEGASGSGSSWADPTGDLQGALAGASAGSEIWVASGRYFPTSCSPCTDSDRDQRFQIPNGVAVYGGFDGSESLVEGRDPEANPTYLSGDIGTAGNNSDNSYTIVYFRNVNANTILDGFILEFGAATSSVFGNPEKRKGGAIYNDGSGVSNSSNPTIRNCVFSNHTAIENGGAICNDGSFNGQANPTFSNCRFEDNSTQGSGAAVANNGSAGGAASPVFDTCTFSTNEANEGGAVYNNGANGTSNPAMTNCKFLNNQASQRGGAMFSNAFNGQSSPTLTRCTFEENQATGSGGALYYDGSFSNSTSSPVHTTCTFSLNESITGNGGAVYNAGSASGNFTGQFIDCQFLTNRARNNFGGGGAVYNDGSQSGNCTPQFDNCTFSGNTADSNGGACYNYGFNQGICNPIYRSCTFSDNVASNGNGGALFNIGDTNGDCSPIIDKSSFTSNQSLNGSGGALFNSGSDDGNCEPLISNTRFISNTANQFSGASYNKGNGETDAQGNLVSSGTCNVSYINCLFYKNSSNATGGTIYNISDPGGEASATVINCTFTQNQSLYGTCMYNNAGNGGTSNPNIANSIFYDNIATFGDPALCTGADPSVFRNINTTLNISYSLVPTTDCSALNCSDDIAPSTVNCGAGMIYNQDPQFADPLNGNFTLAATSPAVDKGDNTAIPAGITLDINGNARIVNNTVDLGPFEKESAPDNDNDGFTSTEDCNDNDNTVYPGAPEICDGKDNDCNGDIDEGVKNTFYADADQDGFGDPGNAVEACQAPDGFVSNNTDCDDTSDAINPGATEIANNGIDENCDGTDLFVDNDMDNDGFDNDVDCDDNDNSVYPGAPEICDGKDNDCNGDIDEGVKNTFYADADQDGFGDPDNAVEACQAPDGFVSNNTDCDDTSDAINPGATEIANNGIDENCDGADLIVDNDMDNDGFDNDVDCDDNDNSVYPGAPEICDGKDNDCNGDIDEGVKNTFYADADQDGFGDPGNAVEACQAPDGFVSNNTDCDDTSDAINPGATEIANNGIDENCDGADLIVDNDMDNDGFDNDVDCNDNDNSVYPGAPELCDGKDNDCNGDTDEGATSIFYADSDGDGFGDPNNTVESCQAPIGFVSNNTDCDDTSSAINPDATEIANNGIDENCDGTDLVTDNDMDNDGFDNDVDCDDNDAEIGGPASACDDGDPCTIDDQLDASCNCAGKALPDSDGDGICDEEDNCPDQANPDQADADENGQGDVCQPDFEYCQAKGWQSEYEFIRRVRFGHLNNYSGNDGGYGDYTHLPIEVIKGNHYELRLTPGFKKRRYYEAWKVWIDWNGDGDFFDPGERVFARKSKYSIKTQVFIPYSAANGPVRMRVAMSYWKYPMGPCDDIEFGEVEDYTLDIIDVSCELVNLARDKDVRQISDIYLGEAHKAIDGNSNGNFKKGSVSHTAFEFQPWWELDLGETKEIDHIVLWNRTDCCPQRLNNFFILISEKPFGNKSLRRLLSDPNVERYYHSGVARELITQQIQARGRYVRIQLAGIGYLSLAEVEVNGCSQNPQRIRELLELHSSKIEQEAHFEWLSNTGYKTDYFVLERSSDGQQFYALQKKEKAGENQEARSYYAVDANPLEGKNFYRIRQVFLNGDSRYSEVQLLEFPLLADLTLFPNPANEFVHIELSKYLGKTVAISIYDELGREMYHTTLSRLDRRLHQINLRGFTNGIYYVLIDTGSKPIRKKLVITRSY